MATTDAQIKVTVDSTQAMRALGDLEKAFKAVAAAVAVGATMDYVSGLQDMSNKLKVSIGDQLDFNSALVQVAAIARSTGSPLAATADLYSKVSFNAKDLGLSTAQVAQTTQNFANALRFSGASAQGAGASMYQFGQMLNSGKVGGDEFRTMIENMGPAMVLMAKQSGLSFRELRDQASAGILDTRDFITMLNNASAELQRRLGDIPLTLNQSFENVKTNFALLVLRFDQATGVTAKLGRVIEALSENLDVVIGLATAFITAWSIAKIVAIAGAIMEIVAALRAMTIMEAMASGGLSLIVSGAAGLAAWYATSQAVSDTNDKLAEYKKLQEEAQKEVEQQKIKYQAIDDKIKKDVLPGMRDQLALAKMSTDQRLIESKVLPIITQHTQGLSEAAKKEVAAKFDVIRGLERQIQLELLRSDIRDKYNKSITAAGIESMIADPKALQVEKAVAEYRIQYGKLFTAELEKQVRINEANLWTITEQAKAYQTYAALTRAETQSQVASRAASMFGQTTGGINVEADRQRTALEALKVQQLISEQDYANQSLLIEQARVDAIIAMNQKVAETKSLLRIQEITGSQFGSDTQKAMAQEATNFEKKSTQEKYAFALDQASQMFSSLGTYNKKAFEASKAFNIANAIMNAYLGATKALATYPPPFNFIAAAATVAAGLAQVAMIRSQTYSGRAIGGPVQSGNPYIVGERGPELFVPSGSGSIVRNDQLSGSSPSVNFTIQANDAAGFDQLLLERKGMIQQMISDAMLERGQRSKM